MDSVVAKPPRSPTDGSRQKRCPPTPQYLCEPIAASTWKPHWFPSGTLALTPAAPHVSWLKPSPFNQPPTTRKSMLGRATAGSFAATTEGGRADGRTISAALAGAV